MLRKPYVEVELDKPRKLKFDFNAIADAEQQSGMGIGKLFSSDQVGFGTFRVLFWAGLRWQDKGLTIERAGKILQNFLSNGGEMTDLGDMVQQAMIAGGFMAEPKEGEEDNEELDEDEDTEDDEKNVL